MRELNDMELDLIGGGQAETDAYYRLGQNFAAGYNWAVGRTTDLFEWLLT